MGACSDGKVVLGSRDLDLARVAIHGYEVAGKARKVVVFDFAYATMRHGG